MTITFPATPTQRGGLPTSSSCARFLMGFALMWSVLLSGCASLPEGHQADARDPWERYNRTVFSINTEVDEAVIKPVAEAYRDVIPAPIRQAFGNFFGNLGDMITTLHHLLQGEVTKAGNSASRVVINSTLGIAGLGDPASDVGFVKTNEDFGQTFGRWGSGPGPYFVLPLLGPSTVRDAVGTAADIASDPFGLVFSVGSTTQTSLIATRVVDKRAGLLDLESTLDALSFDRYAAVRDAYLARRLQQIHGDSDDRPSKAKRPIKDDQSHAIKLDPTPLLGASATWSF